MGKLTLYGVDRSPPVRACFLTLKALNLSYEYIQVSVVGRENLAKEYLAKNPQHTVPTLEDDGHFIWDSHAIIAYLVGKYAEDDKLYPKDHLARAVVDQRLHFETGVLFQGCLRNITAFVIFKNETNVPQYKIDAIVEGYNFLETFLEKHPYIAGNTLTLADFSIITTVTSLVAFVEIGSAKYPKLTAWIERLKQLPYYEEANGLGAQKFVDMIKAKNIKIVQ